MNQRVARMNRKSESITMNWNEMTVAMVVGRVSISLSTSLLAVLGFYANCVVSCFDRNKQKRSA